MNNFKAAHPVAFEDFRPLMAGPLGTLAGKTILVVDDLPELTSLVADVFTAAGAKVRQVNRSADAVPLIVGGAFDILILDLVMPEIDGYMILRFLKQSHPETLSRTIVLTATNPNDHRALVEVEKYRVASLFKPFAIPQLLTTVRRMLACDGPASLNGFPDVARH